MSDGMTERVSLYEAFAERRFLTILGLIIAAVGLYAIYWSHEAGKVKLRWAEMVEDAKAKGLTIASGTVETAGFPYRMELVIHDLSVRASSKAGDVVWRTDQLNVHTLPYRHSHLILDSPGPQEFILGQSHFLLATSDARASLVEETGGARRIAVDLRDPLVSDVAGPIGEAKRFQYHLAENADSDANQVALEIISGRLVRPPLGPVDLSADSDIKRDSAAGYDGTATLSIASDAAAVNILQGLMGLESDKVVRQPGGPMTLSFRIHESKLFSGDRLILDFSGFAGHQ
jgi:hypothetical protein